jgi:plasmid stabilization system protein ParE
MRRLVFRTQADRELAEAIQWYKERDLRVATDFVETVERILQAIQNNPFQYQAIEGDVRSAMLRHFPYKIVYQITKIELIILSCFHTARDLNVLRGRLP